MKKKNLEKENIQLAAADHVTYNKNMSMTADCQKNSGNCEQSIHLLPCLRPCIPPAINTRIKALGQVILFVNIKPCNLFNTKIFKTSGI